MRANPSTCGVLASRVILGGGVPLVGLQEELRGPSGCIPRGFTSNPEREAKQGFPGAAAGTQLGGQLHARCLVHLLPSRGNGAHDAFSQIVSE